MEKKLKRKIDDAGIRLREKNHEIDINNASHRIILVAELPIPDSRPEPNLSSSLAHRTAVSDSEECKDPNANLRQNKRNIAPDHNLKGSNSRPQNIDKGKSQTLMPPPPPRVPSQRDIGEDVTEKGQNPSCNQSKNKQPRSDESSSLRTLWLIFVLVKVHTKKRMVIAESFREFKSYSEKHLPPFDEWDANARDLYVRNLIQRAKVAAGFNDTIHLYESAIRRRVPSEKFAAAENRIADL